MGNQQKQCTINQSQQRTVNQTQRRTVNHSKQSPGPHVGGLREEHPLVLRNRNPRAPRRSPRSALLLRPVPALLDQEMVLRRVGEDQLRRLPLPKDPRGGDGNLRAQWRAALQQGGAARELRGVFWMLARL